MRNKYFFVDRWDLNFPLPISYCFHHHLIDLKLNPIDRYLRRDKTYSADQRWLSGRKRSLIRWPHLDNRYRHLTNNRYWPLENFSVKMVPDIGVALNLYKSCLLTGKRQKFQVLGI
ncbi:hypothetical protein CDAR_198231 [Caerostris darwini]|uniref:Uncharacterized protein n=1 Tax=Caerostris darwini TaxID=1538125 RepID=A0AAV4RR84_9ARAC|nr:hypothetical protein CDAR_198231 [Caerostris darwini]